MCAHTLEEGPTPRATRAGYVTLVGLPNAGKSTLLNQLIGEHLSIVTAKAQTTWQRVTAILTRGDSQLVFLDTPGLLRADDLLQRAMLAAALEALHEADVVLLVVDAVPRPGAEERERLERALAETAAPVHVALNKVELAEVDSVDAWAAWARGGGWTPHRISALTGDGTVALLDTVTAELPPGPFLYPEDDLATGPVRFFVAELVRESIFELYEREIPYSAFCRVEEFREEQEPVYIHVDVYVERSSQKAILIGRGGHAIKDLGRTARAKVEHFLGRRVYLDLWVKALKNWRRNRAHLGSLGFRLPEDDGTGRP